MSGPIPPINPCGAAVDLLRSCYTARVRFFHDSDETTLIRWYFVDESRGVPITPFRSRNWIADNGEWQKDIGEVSPHPFPHANGKRPAEGAIMGPPHLCGTPDQWAGDFGIADRIDPAGVDVLGRPFCCFPPPPLSGLLSLQCQFEAGRLLKAGLSGRAGFAVSPVGGGLLLAGLGAVSNIRPSISGAGALGAALQAVGPLRSSYHGVGILPTHLSTLAGLHAAPQAAGSLAGSLGMLAGLRAQSNFASVLRGTLSGRSLLRMAVPGSGLLSVHLKAVSLLRAAVPGSGLLSARLVLKQLLRAQSNFASILRSNMGLIEDLKAALAAQGIVVSDLELIQALQAASSGQAAGIPTPQGIVSVSVAFASFGLVTPAGGCGSLPSGLVVRFSSGSGHYTTLNGKSATLTFSSGPGTWTGSVATTDGTSTITLACVTTHWALTLSGSAGNGTQQVTGTSGASPSLTGTITLTGPGTGSIVATVTRT